MPVGSETRRGAAPERSRAARLRLPGVWLRACVGLPVAADDAADEFAARVALSLACPVDPGGAELPGDDTGAEGTWTGGTLTGGTETGGVVTGGTETGGTVTGGTLTGGTVTGAPFTSGVLSAGVLTSGVLSAGV